MVMLYWVMLYHWTGLKFDHYIFLYNIWSYNIGSAHIFGKTSNLVKLIFCIKGSRSFTERFTNWFRLIFCIIYGHMILGQIISLDIYQTCILYYSWAYLMGYDYIFEHFPTFYIIIKLDHVI